jgi:hypothetical protein
MDIDLESKLFAKESDAAAETSTDHIVLETMVDTDGRYHLILPQDVPFTALQKSAKGKGVSVFIPCTAEPIDLNIVQEMPDGNTREKAWSTKDIRFSLFLDLR